MEVPHWRPGTKPGRRRSEGQVPHKLVTFCKLHYNDVIRKKAKQYLSTYHYSRPNSTNPLGPPLDLRADTLPRHAKSSNFL